MIGRLEHQDEPSMGGAGMGEVRWSTEGNGGLIRGQRSIKGPYCVRPSKDFGLYTEWI